MDEGRFGLQGWYRRRWCPVGARPPWICDDRYEGRWLSAAVEPTTGQSFCRFLPRLDGAYCELFLREWRRAFPGARWFQELRAPLSNHVHDGLETLEAVLTQALRPYWEHPSALVQLTA